MTCLKLQFINFLQILSIKYQYLYKVRWTNHPTSTTLIVIFISSVDQNKYSSRCYIFISCSDVCRVLFGLYKAFRFQEEHKAFFETNMNRLGMYNRALVVSNTIFYFRVGRSLITKLKQLHAFSQNKNLVNVKEILKDKQKKWNHVIWKRLHIRN